MRNKATSYNTFVPPLSSSWAQLPFFYLLPPSGAGGQGMGAVVS